MTSRIKCGICLTFSSSKEGDYFVNTQCGHIYHFECVTEWIHRQMFPATCPVCREIITHSNLVKLHGLIPVIEFGNGDSSKYNLKVVLLGDSGTGKSSFLHSFSEGVFTADRNSTVGCDMCFKTLEFAGKKIKLSVWDCGGQDRFRAVTPNYLRNINGVCILYDITNQETLENLNKWLQVVYDNAPTDVSIMLVGNKADLNEQRQVSFLRGQNTATELGFEFLEASAKDLTNVEAAFRTLIGTILEGFWNDGQIDSIEISSKNVNLSRFPANLTQQQCRNKKCSC